MLTYSLEVQAELWLFPPPPCFVALYMLRGRYVDRYSAVVFIGRVTHQMTYIYLDMEAKTSTARAVLSTLNEAHRVIDDGI